MEHSPEQSELELAAREIFEQYETQVVTLAQRAVFLPHMWEEGIIGHEAYLAEFEPALSEVTARMQALKDNGATFIGVSRVGYFYFNAQAGHPLKLPAGVTSENLEADESLATANFREALGLLKGLSEPEKDKLLMQAALPGKTNVFLVPKNEMERLKVKPIHGVPAYLGVQFDNQQMPFFSTTLDTCINVIYETIAKNHKIREAEIIIFAAEA